MTQFDFVYTQTRITNKMILLSILDALIHGLLLLLFFTVTAIVMFLI